MTARLCRLWSPQVSFAALLSLRLSAYWRPASCTGVGPRRSLHLGWPAPLRCQNCNQQNLHIIWQLPGNHCIWNGNHQRFQMSSRPAIIYSQNLAILALACASPGGLSFWNPSCDVRTVLENMSRWHCLARPKACLRKRWDTKKEKQFTARTEIIHGCLLYIFVCLCWSGLQRHYVFDWVYHSLPMCKPSTSAYFRSLWRHEKKGTSKTNQSFAFGLRFWCTVWK